MDPIQTHCIFPPIPIRDYDWCAYRDPEKTPYGYGATEAQAIDDLRRLETEEACAQGCGDGECQLASVCRLETLDYL